MQIGEKLKDLIAKHGLTYKQLSDASGVSDGTIKTICNTPNSNPGFENVCALLVAMDESIDEFYKGVPSERSEAVAAAEVHHHHHLSVMPFKADVREMVKEAMQEAQTAELVKLAHNHLTWWRWVSIVLIAIIITWFVWDITHPRAGLIQYGSALGNQISGMLNGGTIRL